MRVGIDCRLPYYRMGGISQYVLHLIQALADLDEGSTSYTIFHSRKDTRTRLPGASRFIRSDLWTPSHHRWERWSLSLELLLHQLDVFHSPDFVPPAFGATRRIITVHDLNFLYYPEFLTPESGRYYSKQIGWAVRQSHHVIADSHATRRDIIERLRVPAEKVSTIYLAANPIYQSEIPEEDVADTLERYNLPGSFILFVGTLEPRKNLPMLIRAYEVLHQNYRIDLPLVLVGGKGWIYEEIFATIDELGLQARVRHLSTIMDVELSHLYSAASVLVLPSFYEGFGLPLLEAMHCGCPVIASNRSSLPEVAGEAAILLPPEDVEAWADSIARLATDSDLRTEMIARGRSQAGKFTWRKTAEATLDIYRNSLLG